MEENGVRINKYLSEAGVCSRREADRKLEAGEIRINGRIATVGDRVHPGEKVEVDGQEVTPEEKMVLLVFHKPEGIVCTAEKKEKNNVVDFIHYPTRIYPVGRLDKDSTGLLLMTNNGEIVNKIMRAGNAHEKEYLVTVNKPITDSFLKGMAGGVPILDTMTRQCEVERLGKRKFRIVLTQGLNRQIRRMCEYFGYRVVSLERVRIMNIELGDLAVGKYREITEKEWKELNRLIENSSNETVIRPNRSMPKGRVITSQKEKHREYNRPGGASNKKDEYRRNHNDSRRKNAGVKKNTGISH